VVLHLSNNVLTILVLAALALSALAAGLLVFRTVREGSRSANPPPETVKALLDAQAKSILRLESAVRQLAAGERRLAELFQGGLQHWAVVRFDAFEDRGGRLSFSAALLDEHSSGVVITSINGRQDARCYAKQVQNGTSIHNLSDEEEQAIREAMGRGVRTTTAEAS
jgi:hypothetical protein